MERDGATGVATASTAILTIPNVMSLARLATVPVFVWLFVSGREDAAVILYGIGAWSDFFDGYIARRTNSVSELGRLLDPLADRIFIVALIVALVARRTIPWWLAVAIVARDLLLVSAFPILERRGVERISVNAFGKAATACLLIGLTWLALSETSFGWARIGRNAGLPFVGLGALLYWTAGAMYAGEARDKLRALARGASKPDGSTDRLVDK